MSTDDALGWDEIPAPPRVRPGSRLPVALRAGALFAVEGASLGMFAWALRSAAKLSAYAINNDLTARGRKLLLADMFVTAAAALLAAIVSLLITRGRNLERLDRLARRLSPLAVVGMLPFLARWNLWNDGRELNFLVMAALTALAARATVLASLRAGTVLEGPVARALRAGTDRAAAVAARCAAWAPPLAVCLAVVWYGVFFSHFTVANHHNLRTASLDLGLEDNLLWNLVHGGPFLKTSPGFGPVGGHFGFHATFFAYVIGAFYFFAQRAETMLIFQAWMIAVGAVPLYLFARRHVGNWAAALIAIAYLLYPPVHGSNLYDFHYLPLAPFFLWSVAWLVESKRWWLAALAVLLTLSIREDVAAGLAMVGLYLVLAGERPRAGVVVTAVAGAYFVALKLVLMPHALHGASSFIHQYAGLLPPGENSFGAVLKTVIGNPVFTLHSLTEREKLIYILQIAVPLCFLPWTSTMGLLCSLPGFFFTLLATQYPPLIQISFQYTAHWTPYLFIALVWNLRRIGTTGATAAGAVAEDAPLRRRAWLAGLAVAMLLTSHQFGALMQQNTARGGFGLYSFQTTDADRTRYATLKELIKMIPPRAKIVSSENIVPHVTQRPNSYTLRMSFFDAEYALVMLPVRGDEATHVRQELESGAFGVVTIKEPFALLRRGQSGEQNAAVLGRI